jgi:flagellar assembly factor FliW
MEMQTKFYGKVNFEEQDILNFPAGLPGFEKYEQFILLQPTDSVFGCLQSVDEPALAFVTISPYKVCPDYSIRLTNDDVQKLQLKKADDAELLAVVSIRPKMEDSSVNLQAPLVINRASRIGQQVLLPESGYPIRFSLWDKSTVSEYRCSVNS